VVDGESEEEIKTFLLERYGDFVLYRPRVQRSTAVLWAAPVLLLAIGAVALGMVVRRRSTLPSDVDADENLPGKAGPSG
jgi:cytochrome c-type biogenesis protein CcmH